MTLRAQTGQGYLVAGPEIRIYVTLCGVVNYRIAVPHNAYSIQTLDASRFDTFLIMVGNFHLELTFYGVIGTFINESGAEYLLTESGILAEVHRIAPTRNVCDGTAASSCIRNNRAANNAVTDEQNWETVANGIPFSMQSQNRVTPSHYQHQHMRLPLEHCYRKSSILGNSGVFDGKPCLLPQISCKVSRGMRSR